MMTNNKMKSTMFTGFLFIMGLLLMIFSFDIESRIKKDCESDDLRKANIGLLIIGTFFVAIASSTFYCMSTCSCTSTDLSLEVYIGFIFFMSIVLVTLSSIIKTKFEKCDKKSGKSQSPDVLLGISCCLLILSFGYLASIFYESYKGSPKASSA